MQVEEFFKEAGIMDKEALRKKRVKLSDLDIDDDGAIETFCWPQLLKILVKHPDWHVCSMLEGDDDHFDVIFVNRIAVVNRPKYYLATGSKEDFSAIDRWED